MQLRVKVNSVMVDVDARRKGKFKDVQKEQQQGQEQASLKYVLGRVAAVKNKHKRKAMKHYAAGEEGVIVHLVMPDALCDDKRKDILSGTSVIFHFAIWISNPQDYQAKRVHMRRARGDRLNEKESCVGDLVRFASPRTATGSTSNLPDTHARFSPAHSCCASSSNL